MNGTTEINAPKYCCKATDGTISKVQDIPCGSCDNGNGICFESSTGCGSKVKIGQETCATGKVCCANN